MSIKYSQIHTHTNFLIDNILSTYHHHLLVMDLLCHIKKHLQFHHTQCQKVYRLNRKKEFEKTVSLERHCHSIFL